MLHVCRFPRFLVVGFARCVGPLPVISSDDITRSNVGLRLMEVVVNFGNYDITKIQGHIRE